jgi:hypothetical protein
MSAMPESSPAPPGVDPTTPSPARIYDYVLGGTHNFPVDREAAERIRARSPDLADAAWVNRGFHQRAARWMAAEQGIGQFIDIGSGLPTQSNTHGVVQKVIPRAHVVYVDNDPMVLAYAGELLSDDGSTTVINADLRDVDAVLNDPALRSMIDFARPVGLLITAVLHFVADDANPWSLVARYADALAPDSYLALSHITYEGLPPRLVEEGVNVYAQAQGVYPRSREQIERFFAGLQVVPPYPGGEPAITHIGVWGAEDPELADSDGSHWWYGGVAHHP